MSLRRKTVLGLLLMTIGLILLLYFMANSILLEGFTHIEAEDTEANTERVLASITNEFAQMSSTTSDWAFWDDTYAYMSGGNESYVEKNLIDDTFITLELNLILLISSSGEVVYAKAYDLVNDRETPLNDGLLTYLKTHSSLWSYADTGGEIIGFVILPDEILMVASKPILNSLLEGPPHGTLMMGRYFDRRMLRKLEEVTNLSIDIQRWDQSPLPEDFQAVKSNFSQEVSVIVRPLNENRIAGYALMRDVYDEPAVLIRVDTPRHIYNYGKLTLSYYLLSLVVISLVFGVVVYFSLDKLILTRLDRLNKEIKMVGVSGDLSMRVTEQGKDEVGDLAEEINRTLTSLERVEAALQENQERYLLAVKGSNDGIWDWDLRHDQIYFSPRWKAILGFPESWPIAQPQDWLARIHPRDLPRFREELDNHLSGVTPFFASEHRILHHDGTYHWVLVRGMAIREADQQAHRIAGSMTEVTAQKALEERLRYDAMHDHLTRLTNRAYFMHQLSRVIEKAKRHEGYRSAVLFIDLDRFKMINDSLDHIIGDQVLIAVSRRLERCIRPEDTLSRFGGDEFVILLEDIQDSEVAIKVAQRIQDELAMPYEIEGHKLYITASIGIALTDGEHERPEELLRNADIAVYQAKTNGRARYEIFGEDMRVYNVAMLQAEADLRQAFERRELILYYQPIVSLSDGEIIGVEALVRWEHPYRGLVLPGEFIPLAEETGLIRPLTEWVLYTACEQAKSWHNTVSPNLGVAVNISVNSLRDRDFPKLVQQIISMSDFPSQLLQLEITENAAMADFDVTIESLRELDCMGVKLAIDDFGAGYFSLAYLKRFPVSAIKIDRSFIQNAVYDPADGALASAIIAMGHILKLRVIAEGVEKHNQLDFLRSHECDAAQGFLFSHPVPADTITTLLLPGHYFHFSEDGKV